MSFQPVSFGKYELVSRLAAGGMAEIFLARTKGIAGFEKYLVIKRILGHRTQDPEFVRMFLDEARVAATLDHPNIVQIYDVGHVDNEYFIAMEYLRGHNLIEIVRAGAKLGYAKPPLEHVVSILTQVCAGLHYAHDKRDFEGRSLEIVHRDVTPQNVVVSFDGSVKVVDFGIAKAATREVETLAGTLKGKIGYMSPEQCRGAPVDRRSDLFAVGIILFELTTGKRLYHERSDFDTLKKIIEGPVPSPRDLLPFYPAFLNAIVVRCLQKNPDDRYQTARDLHADLDAFGRDNQLVTGTVPLAQYMERIYADELATHKSSDAAAMATAAQMTMTGSSSSYLGESSRRSSSPMATPLAEARRQHMVRVGLQATIAVLLVVLGGGVVFWQTRGHQQGPTQPAPILAAAQPAAPPTGAPVAPKTAAPAAPASGAPATAVASPIAAATLPGGLAPRPHLQAKPGDAHITVASEPRCELLVDGTPYGSTPIIDLSVPAGKHTIVLLNSAVSVREVQKVQLREGELWTRSFSFDAGGKASVQNSLSAKMLGSHDAPVAKAEPPVAAKPAAAPSSPKPAAPAPSATASAPPSAPKPVDGAASGGKPAAAPTAVASMAPAQKPKNVNAHTLDSQQISHADPHLPEIVRIQRKGTGDARFAAKVCINNEGRVYQVNVLQSIPGADDAVVNAIKQWSYKPQPVSVCFVANIIFDL
ncbi:MAG: Serine/threonine protein kinase PrkC, regulator of stationary phase [Myxococcales bacterium]|nr:Serine/threonine protein kinase PrkC, regulator of stationary phase [Myxococcales bacterium]